MKSQVIKIKPADQDKAAIRAFSRSAWEAAKAGPLKGKKHLSQKRKEPKYKNRFHELEQ